jgi:hypothetical protein
MKIYLNEQDIANAICIFVADLERIDPGNVQMEFQYEEGQGICCEVSARGQRFIYHEQRISDAIGFLLEVEHNFSTQTMEVEIDFDEQDGIIAHVTFSL